MDLKLGIVTPVVHLNPRFAPPKWEETGTIDDIIYVAREAEKFGYKWVACSEHIAIPDEAAPIRGGRYWDPTTTLSFVAANTNRIRLLSHMAVLPYHHPLELIKRWGTLDVASKGRVILGVGVGSLQQEFELLGHEFSGRGDRSDDALRAIRASWGNNHPSYRGTHYQYSGFSVEPSGESRPIQIWVGGRTRRSLRRAIELGDGWMPFRLLVDDVRRMLAHPDIQEAFSSRDSSFDIILPPDPPLDPIGAPGETADVVSSLVSVGASGLSLRFKHYSRTHYVEQMEAMTTIVDSL